MNNDNRDRPAVKRRQILILGKLLVLIVAGTLYAGQALAPREDPLKTMVLIPAGEFLRGSDDADIKQILQLVEGAKTSDYKDEQPKQKISLDAFYIDKYEVSNAQYQQFLNATQAPKPSYWDRSNFNKPDYPVVGVNWEEAKAYCEWAKKRLPTEAEWEKAARGTDGRLWPWGNNFTPLYANTHGKEDGYYYTAPVESFPLGKSPYGVYNMGGNVDEWVADWYDGNYYKSAPKENPHGPPSGTQKVVRGGSWLNDPDGSRIANRTVSEPASRDSVLGFRCAKSQ
ncbi:MAG: formylglycine-generating enzyme family protein [Candidatus Tectomicrobia bacterium]|nr:formylglycine-generating enzyme family protein [Candidatus Tectomicrobia bacterium]